MKIFGEVAPNIHLAMSDKSLLFHATTKEAEAELQLNFELYQDVLNRLGRIMRSEIRMAQLRIENLKMIKEHKKEV
ncbi:hypothetical protein BFS35_006805 [Macrococcoides goetzii]|uniref:Uncharacterized protein n=1 Tax=Macrococcoides goetzii TaxID=1891097 RepID=A0A395GB50_9STAP|nr:hypothetical protein [Macrococcus goetzii]RAI81271.1 hypothetical protein BFS35_006805 [Macrococcus goetzii]